MRSKPTRGRRDGETGAPAPAGPEIDAGRETSPQLLEPATAEVADSRSPRRVRVRADRDRANVIDAP
jgi:hypothetical protein